MPPKGKTSAAQPPAKKMAAKPKSSSAKAQATAQTPFGVDAHSTEAPQASASVLEDREPILRKAVKPVAAVSASADAPGAPAPVTAVSSFIRPLDTQSKSNTRTWNEMFMVDLGMTMDPESLPEPNNQLRHDQAPASGTDPDTKDNISVLTHARHNSAAASSPPPVQRKLTRQEWKAQRAGRATAQSTGAASVARKRPASSSPLKETGASRWTRHVPAKHDELFYQSEGSHGDSCKGGPSEEGEIAQPHQAEEVSNLLDE
ncbi:hypothetical protein BBJ28_00020794 [Nothophytophthora sp. Chile5]|nr:hypothetical protein BBJ28_00020794 [Nothophytophthora sp. Chile5]